MEIKLRGYDQFMARIQAYPQVAAKAIRVTARTGAREILKIVKSRVPVRSGDLKRSMRITRSRKSRQGEEYYGVGFQSDSVRNVRLARHARALGIGSRRGFGLRGYHWRYLEYGTKRMSARPFIGSDFDSAAQTAAQAGIDWMDKNV